VWSPESGESQPGIDHLDPLIGGSRNPEGHSSFSSQVFDLGADGSRSGGYGPLS
jgi:hypothetical protein